MKQIKFKNETHEFNFEIDKYNIMINKNKQLYIEFFWGLYNASGISIDLANEKLINFQVFINGDKLSKKNFVLLDFTNIQQILENITMNKDSNLSKYYLESLSQRNIDLYKEEIFEKLNEIFLEIFEEKLISNEPDFNKILKLFYTININKKEIDCKIKNIDQVLNELLLYIKEDMHIVVLIDSNDTKILDVEQYIEYHNLYFIDKSKILSQTINTNLITFNSTIKSMYLDYLIEEVFNDLPIELSREKLSYYLERNFSNFIINEEIDYYKYDDDLILLHILVRTKLELPILNINNIKKNQYYEYIKTIKML